MCLYIGSLYIYRYIWARGGGDLYICTGGGGWVRLFVHRGPACIRVCFYIASLFVHRVPIHRGCLYIGSLYRKPFVVIVMAYINFIIITVCKVYSGKCESWSEWRL